MTISKRALLIPALLFSLLLTACQQSDSPETPPSDATTKAAADTMAEPENGAAGAEETESCELVMGWDPWEPYHYEGSDGETRGMDVDLATAMAEGAGCTLSFARGEWAELLKELQAGRIDILAGATKIEERESYAWFSDPYRSESFNLHVASDRQLPGNDLFALIEDGFRLGLTEGYIYGPAITAVQDNPLLAQRIVYSPIAEYHFNNLVEGRIDGFLEDPYVAEAIARRRGWEDQVRALPISFGNHEVRFMFSRASVDGALVDRLNASLQQMAEAGETDKIMQRYQHQGP